MRFDDELELLSMNLTDSGISNQIRWIEDARRPYIQLFTNKGGVTPLYITHAKGCYTLWYRTTDASHPRPHHGDKRITDVYNSIQFFLRVVSVMAVVEEMLPFATESPRWNY